MAGDVLMRSTRRKADTADHEMDAQSDRDLDKYVELDCELAVALANVTEGARATALRVTQVEPSHGFVAWQALVDGLALRPSNDPAIALQSIPATPKKAQGRKGIERKAHSMVIESGQVRGPIQSDR